MLGSRRILPSQQQQQQQQGLDWSADSIEVGGAAEPSHHLSAHPLNLDSDAEGESEAEAEPLVEGDGEGEAEALAPRPWMQAPTATLSEGPQAMDVDGELEEPPAEPPEGLQQQLEAVDATPTTAASTLPLPGCSCLSTGDATGSATQRLAVSIACNCKMQPAPKHDRWPIPL